MLAAMRTLPSVNAKLLVLRFYIDRWSRSIAGDLGIAPATSRPTPAEGLDAWPEQLGGRR